MTVGTLFVLALILPDHHPRRGDIHHLSALDRAGLHGLQVPLAMLAALHCLDDHLIWGRRELQALAGGTRLSSGLLAALFPQAPGLAHEAIRGGRQVTVVAVFGQPLFQRLEALLQLRDQFVPLRKLVVSLLDLFSQRLIFCSKLDQFFFCYALTLQRVARFGKSLGDLSSYKVS